MGISNLKNPQDSPFRQSWLDTFTSKAIEFQEWPKFGFNVVLKYVYLLVKKQRHTTHKIDNIKAKVKNFLKKVKKMLSEEFLRISFETVVGRNFDFKLL